MTKSITRISAKGQVVIPAGLLRTMHVEGGDVVLLSTDDSVIVIEPAPSWVEQTRGALQVDRVQLDPGQLEAIIEATATIEAFEEVGSWR